MFDIQQRLTLTPVCTYTTKHNPLPHLHRYLFALDLMGRNTPAARIFANMAQEGVKNSKRRISIYLKLLCILVILAGNATSLVFAVQVSERWILYL